METIPYSASTSVDLPPFQPTYKGWKPLIKPVAIGKVLETFQPTYKGWKQGGSLKSPGEEATFQPTYKGWKQPIGYHHNNFPNTFQPTYKGWKLHCF